eukprot:TRINITY_DN68198_c8_g3_i1.p1 TRINITY_DN68198_c8_g3~~TRINITY_DN68198_c8_g3_i1.p1  ORF type:complete len:388 (-),score=-0.71 TRINITY_DN68198_c8_g3_i1:256-1392(-)
MPPFSLLLIVFWFSLVYASKTTIMFHNLVPSYPAMSITCSQASKHVGTVEGVKYRFGKNMRVHLSSSLDCTLSVNGLPPLHSSFHLDSTTNKYLSVVFYPRVGSLKNPCATKEQQVCNDRANAGCQWVTKPTPTCTLDCSRRSLADCATDLLCYTNKEKNNCTTGQLWDGYQMGVYPLGALPTDKSVVLHVGQFSPDLPVIPNTYPPKMYQTVKVNLTHTTSDNVNKHIASWTGFGQNNSKLTGVHTSAQPHHIMVPTSTDVFNVNYFVCGETAVCKEESPDWKAVPINTVLRPEQLKAGDYMLLFTSGGLDLTDKYHAQFSIAVDAHNTGESAWKKPWPYILFGILGCVIVGVIVYYIHIKWQASRDEAMKESLLRR